jgi:hypothetical protein
MRITSKLYDQIMEAAEASDYEYIGVRVQDVPFTLGPINHNSHRWDNGDDTGEELDGVCVIDVKMLASVIKHMHWYYGEHIALLGAYSAEYGEDYGELVLSEAETIAIFA